MEMDFGKIIQIGFLTKDVRRAVKEFAELFHMPEPQISRTHPYEVTGARYLGKRCDGLIEQGAFDLENLQIEFIEPVGEEKSYWKDFLDQYGEGLNHISVKVRDMEACIKKMEEMGYAVLQHGTWPEGGGGAYAYIDMREKMGMILELLEFFEENT